MPTTLKMLQDHSPLMLEIIGEMRSARVETAGAERAILLATELSSPDSVQSVLEEIQNEYPQAQTALQTLAKFQGAQPEAQFTRAYGMLEVMGDEQLKAKEPWHNPRTLTELLYYYGLIGRGFEGAGAKAHRIIYIPSDILDQIPLPSEDVSEGDIHIPYAPAPSCREVLVSTDEFLNDVGSAIGCLVGAPLLLEGKDLAQPDAERLQERLLAPPDTPLLRVRWALLLHVLNRLQLFKREKQKNDQRFVALNRNRANDFLGQTRHVQRRRIWDAWRDSPDWSDLERLPDLELHNRERWQHNSLATRSAFLDFCRNLQPTRWYALPDLVALLKEHMPDFQRPDGNYDDWYIRHRKADRFVRGFKDWDLVEGELARFYLLGPMIWLGALKVAEQGHKTMLSLTRDGAVWQGADLASAREEVQPRFVVQKDFSIVAPLGLPLRQRMNIEQVAYWQRSSTQYEYRINQRSLSQAFARGVTVDRVLAGLRNGSHGVPHTVEAAIRQFADQHGFPDSH